MLPFTNKPNKSVKHGGNPSELIALAATITRETETLDRYLKENGLPHPGFEVDSPLNFPKFPKEIKKARENVLRATRELGDLVAGPSESVRWMAWDVSLVPLHFRSVNLPR